MKLTGTARGNNLENIHKEAHRQAKTYYGENTPYELTIIESKAYVEYIREMYGSPEEVPLNTMFEARFIAVAEETK